MTYPVPQKGQLPPLGFDGCDWIWSPQAKAGPASRAPPQAKRFFRGVVTIPAGKVIRRTRLLTAAGGDYEVFVNGKPASRFGDNTRRRAPRDRRRLAPGRRTRTFWPWPSPMRRRGRPGWPASW